MIPPTTISPTATVPIQSRSVTRRSFVGGLAAGTAMAMPALSYSRVYGSNNRLGIASIGTGGKGWSDLTGVAASPDVQVIALCDIDSSLNHLGRAAEKYSAAKTYSDWRKLLDESKEIQGVLVSTPDFMHAPISLAAMHLGKHVFCQKPLTHSVQEARQMRIAAKKSKSITQMGNQIQSHSAYRTAVQWVRSGLIGKVKEVHSWQGGKTSWPRGIARPEGVDSVPDHVRWDLWQGVAPERPFKKEMYHPFNWRAWQDYGTGQLGDFGCHILDPVFKALQLTAPTSIQAEGPEMPSDAWTDRAIVRYSFPGNEATLGKAISLTWYDGVQASPSTEGLKDLPPDYKLPTAGSLLIGEKGTLVIPHVAMPKLFPLEKFPEKELPIVPAVDHYIQWGDACRGIGETTSHFDFAGPLTETVLLGTIAIRYPKEVLKWDWEKTEISNNAAANKFVAKQYRRGWEPAWF